MDKAEAHKRLKAYLNSGRTACPYCGNHTINNCETYDTPSGNLRRTRTCRTCGKSWRDIFRPWGLDLFEADTNGTLPVYTDDKEVT